MQMSSWQELANPRDLTKIFTTPEYASWRSLRESEDARYLGLTMPRFLARLPYGAKTSILAYRRDIFEKQSLNIPNTYYEFETLLPVLRDRTALGALSSRGKIGHQCVHAWLLHLNPMSGKIFDVSWKPRFDDSVGVRALKFLQLVIQTGPAGATEFGYNEMAEAFLQGGSAMYLDSTAIIGAVRNSPKSKVAGKVAYARHPKASMHSSQSGGFGLAIPTNAKHAEAAFLLMQWLTSKAQDKAVCRLGGGPVRVSTLQDEAMLREFPEYLVLRTQLRDAEPDWRPIIPEWDEINVNALDIAIGETLQGKRSADTALTEVVPKVVEIMRQGGYLKS
jgi:multiple sugar transport system substrate-binding protein